MRRGWQPPWTEPTWQEGGREPLTEGVGVNGRWGSVAGKAGSVVRSHPAFCFRSLCLSLCLCEAGPSLALLWFAWPLSMALPRCV